MPLRSKLECPSTGASSGWGSKDGGLKGDLQIRDQTATQTIRSAVETVPITDATEANAEFPLLTPREQEILSLMAQGKNNQEIAQELYITPGTVRVHVHAVLQKLGVRDRTQAVLLALQKQLLSQ